MAQTKSVRYAILAAIGVLLVVPGCNKKAATENSGLPPQPSQAAKRTPVAVSRPTIPAPKFRVFKAKTDEPTTIVVAVNTSDDQLKSLLWLFREKVRSHQFKDLGLTSKAWDGVNSGMLVVYRGEKCANEEYSDSSPCGNGEHDDAYYQWGLEGDPNKDAACIRHKDAGDAFVFDYKDGWQLSSDLKARLESKEQADQSQRELFARLLQDRLTGMGFDMSVRPSPDPKDELHIDGDMFKDTATRVQFINQVLPRWKPDLCKAGFRSVRLTRGGFLEIGQSYSLGCK